MADESATLNVSSPLLQTNVKGIKIRFFPSKTENALNSVDHKAENMNAVYSNTYNGLKFWHIINNSLSVTLRHETYLALTGYLL